MSEPVKRFSISVVQDGYAAGFYKVSIPNYGGGEVVPAESHDSALAALTLTWREDKPTEAGWYWWRFDASCGADIIRIVKRNDGALVEWNGGDQVLVGQWAGPLAPPQDGTREG